MTLEQLIQEHQFVESLLHDYDVSRPEILDKYNKLQEQIQAIIDSK